MSSTESSAVLLERLRLAHGKDINLSLRSSYAALLDRLGNPHTRLAPTLIVAGTNGKGSTCAFLRAMIEAEGKTAHVYTSPHLVRFHERIRLAGQLISENDLCAKLRTVENNIEPVGSVSLFEAITATAFLAFAENKADATILEVGLGGRLDATNVVPDPVGTVISRLSFDHRDYLGSTMAEIAREKAGIMRTQTPCFVAPQPSAEALQTLEVEAQGHNAPLLVGQRDWQMTTQANGLLRFASTTRTIADLPMPALTGPHQIFNAGLAIAASAALPFAISDSSVRHAMRTVSWPGRLQLVTQPGPLLALVPDACELWLDGGHNDSAGQALAQQMKVWREQDDRPVDLIYGMLSTKNPAEFLAPLSPFIRRVRTITIQGEVPGYDAQTLAEHVRNAGIHDVEPCASLPEALKSLDQPQAARTLICGSLVLVGEAIRRNADL